MTFLRADIALWIVLVVVWVGAAPFSRRTVRRAPLRSQMTHILEMLGTGMLLNRRFFAHTLLDRIVVPHATWSGIVSVAVTAAGVAIALWARWTLGRLWSGTVTLKEGHRLVDTGPYALARHPIYTGLLVAAIGTVLRLGTVRDLLVIPFLVIGLLLKIRVEEKLLAAQFGDEHRRYTRRVKALVPFAL